MGGVGFVSCSDDNNGLELPQEQLAESGYITLSLKCVEGTRAPENYTEDGVEGLNENWIETVTICLWANGGDKPDDTAKPDYVQTFTDVDRNNTASFRIPLTLALKNKLFETSGATCHAFAAVNVTPPSGEFTIADLRNLTVKSTFSSRRRQDFFTMDGDCVVTYDRVSNSATSDTGYLYLQRSASKITLALDVDDIVEQTAIVDGALVTSKWMPDTKTMRVWLKGGLAESTLDPNLKAKPSEEYFFDTPDNLTYTFVANEAGKNNTPDNGNNPPANGETTRTYPFIQDRPFYTYPHSWESDPNDYAATYMILSIPWMQVNDDGTQIPGTTWRTCYYQVPVIPEDSDPLQLVRNVSYHVYLHVGLLGSFEPDVPLVLDQELEYSAAEWGTVNMDVNIPNVRYLVVDQNDYTVNNETSINIPFYTSHETIVTDATMTFYRYNYDDVGRELPVTVSMRKNHQSFVSARDSVFVAYFNNKTKELEVSHELVMYQGMTSGNVVVSFTQNDRPAQTNKRPIRTEDDWNTLMNTISYFQKVSPTTTMTDVNEYSRVEFKITLQHKDIYENKDNSHNFEEVITITQYPGMYITTNPNYCPISSTTFNFSGAQGNTFINGNCEDMDLTQGNPSGGNPTGWTYSIGLHSGYNNFNPNLYLVTVTTLPSDTPYKIGDPRSSVINNNLGSGVANDVNGPLPTNSVKAAWTSSQYTYIPNQVSGQPTVSSPVTVTGFATADAIYSDNDANNRNGDRRTLSYYYPTLEDDAHKMMIAPKFRICSSYAGTTWILNRELSRRRAAAYQEMGYAAGRWRLPTFGEVAFVMQLAADFKIPRLFGTTTAPWYYWCANGLVYVPAKNNTQSTTPKLPGDSGFEGPVGANPNATYPNARNPWVQRARFVYDEWYWGEADLKASGPIGSDDPVYTFTWGDKPY